MRNVAIIIGRGGSKGFPGKNKFNVLGKPLMAYPILAALESKYIDYVYFSTEDDELKKIADVYGAKIIHRSEELADDKSLSEDVFLNAFWRITENHFFDIEYVALMFANAPCITGWMIDDMIKKLQVSDADSICTVSKYNMFSPYRARILDLDDVALNFINNDMITCNRDSGGDFYFYDCSCAIVKSSIFKKIAKQPGPQPWLGRYILSYIQSIPALDVDYEWQLGQVEYWLKKNNIVKENYLY
jgi:CMP-N-acetylneuraminic acid synthetase